MAMDLVVNRSSGEHRWFVEARKSRDNTYRDYSTWSDNPSTRVVFSPSASEYEPASQQYYVQESGPRTSTTMEAPDYCRIGSRSTDRRSNLGAAIH
jgi:glycosidase